MKPLTKIQKLALNSKSISLERRLELEAIDKAYKDAQIVQNEKIRAYSEQLHAIDEVERKYQDGFFTVSASSIYQTIKDFYGKEIYIDDSKRAFWWTLAYYFANDERFLNSPLIKTKPNLSKSLYIYSDCGIGKSSAFEAVRVAYTLARGKSSRTVKLVKEFKIIDTNKQVEEYAKYGGSVINSILAMGDVLIDDAGTEEETSYYGKKTDMFKSILEQSYKLTQKIHITTNLSPSELSERYDKKASRIGSRIFEKYNVIKLEGEDLRVSLNKK